jgi:disease resistance protein RPM1
MDPLISVIFGAVMQKLGDMINEGHNLRKDLKLLLPAIKDDLAVLCGSAEDLSAPRNHRSGKGRQAWIQQIQDLAYEIEDCLDRHSAAVDYEADDSLLLRLLGRAKTMESRTQFAKEISDLKNKVQDAIKRKALIMDVKEEPAADCDCGGGGYVPECELVGIEDPKKEVRDLLLLHRQEEPRPRLKVVSIVGPRGLGKTALAWAVYDSLDGDDEFNCRAKVTASDCVDSKDLLMKILLQVKGDKEVTAADKEEPGRSLRVHLMSKKR